MIDDILPPGLGAPMAREELDALVAQLGGIEAAASKIDRAPSTVLAWSRGQRSVPTLIAYLLRVSVLAANAPAAHAEALRTVEAEVYDYFKLKSRRRGLVDSVHSAPPEPPSPPPKPRKPRRMPSAEIKRCVKLLGGVQATAEAIGCAPSLIPHYQYGKRVMPEGLVERLRQEVERKLSAP